MNTFEGSPSAGSANEAPPKLPWQDPADALAAARDADIYLYNGRIMRPSDRQLFQFVTPRNRHKNLIFIIVTGGGDADAAFRMARCLQIHYSHITVFIPGYCKSAGTLLATAGHELAISDQGELGPLDVQMQKADELWETSSGLTVMEAINTLEETAYRMLEDGFMRIKSRSGGQITFRTATEVSVAMVTGLLEPIYKQIDPLHVGEAGRAMNVARDYAERLSATSKSLKPNVLGDLIALYSSHGFVIDREEAAKYFNNVRPPTPEEEGLAELLGDMSRITQDKTLSGYVSTELPRQAEQEAPADDVPAKSTKDGGTNGRPTEEVAGVAGDAADSRE